MADKKYNFEDTESSYYQRKTDEDLWSEISELAQEQYEKLYHLQDGTSGKQAKSFQDGGRGCVRCGGSLMIFEETENGYLLLECRSCGKKQFHSDIEPNSAELTKMLEEEAKVDGYKGEIRNIPDELYRTIPDSLILEYTQMRERSRQGN